MARIPILCYHRIETPPAGAERDSNFTTPTTFARHLATLAAAGYTGITIRDLRRWQRGEVVLPPRCVAITFDDGYASVVDAALPALALHGWPCTVFVVSAAIGGTNRWDPLAPPARLLDANAVRALHAHGHDIGSHSRHHVRIRGLDHGMARDELAQSRHAIEDLLSAPCTSFAFPYGSHDRTSLARVADAGYDAACTLKRWGNGRRTNPLRLGRMSVGGPLSPLALHAKLLKLFLTPARQ
jgi:peptidoglycan/xylan/chitin deacetylase (PgdA/CDA1 family)